MRNHVAANPINYAIFYDYVSEKNPNLTHAVDVLLSEHKAFDYETSLELYGKHICNTSLESFEKINDRIQKVIKQTSENINTTYEVAEKTSGSFKEKKAMLETIAETSLIRDILQEIIEETRAFAFVSQSTQRLLNQANDELEQLRLELAQVREIAITDGLTGLLNRRAFDKTLNDVIHHAQTNSTCLSLMDIDFFKRVNDTHGHIIGDSVIKYVASLMRKYALSHHYVARYGGEELAIIMPNTSKQQAFDISENIRLEMQKSRLKRKTDNMPLGTITISIGVAELNRDDDYDSFVARADKALYKAKDGGRNKVVYCESKNRLGLSPEPAL
ncbi:MAG: GGDEF domain-containing protein [Gammaproteobacteria bacterium]